VYLLTINQSKNLLLFSLIGNVVAAEVRTARAEVEQLLHTLTRGFTFLTDFTNVESMSEDAAPEIGLMMELSDKNSVGLVIRIFPDSSKDIGMNILTTFHYHQPPHVITCRSMIEAAEALIP
jgi:hypothetical protein